MRINFKPLTLYDIQFMGSQQKARLESYKRFIEDKNKKERLKDQQCVLCFYGGRFGGAAMTTFQCGLCEKELHSSNTNVDAMCAVCAKKHGLCKHCGADMEYKQRRKL